MELILVAVTFIRLVVPLSIFRWPLPGAIASMLADGVDYWIFGYTTGVPSYYSVYDKVLDIYYLSFEFIVSLGWASLSRLLGMSLYLYRMAGLVMFVALRVNAFLFFFPNVFEFFFIFELLRARYFRRSEWNLKRVGASLFFLSLLKLSMEYAQHVRHVNYFAWLKSFLF